MTSDTNTNSTINYNLIIKIVIGILIIAGCYGLYRYIENKANVNEAKWQAQIAELTKQNGDLAIQLAKAKNDYMEMKANPVEKTTIEYVEKTSKDDGDFEVNQKAPKVVVNAGDGNRYEYTPDAKTTSYIKDGKMVMSTENTVNLDIEKITDARFKDKVAAIEAKHKVEIKEKEDTINTINRKWKMARRQRDFYAGVAVVGTGVAVCKTWKF